MHTLIPIELLPYLQSVAMAITETKGSLDELATFNYIPCLCFDKSGSMDHE
jgi:hypothetical protein